MKKLILALGILCLSASNTFAATYYFSSDSTGGDGSIGNPWYNLYPHKDGAAALSPDDICLYKAGSVYTGNGAYVIIDSDGTSGHPITFGRYGTGADPVFTTATPVTGWTYTGANGIYYKTGLFGLTYTIGVDGTSALGQFNSTSLPAGSFYNSGGTIYIRLADSSDPAGHTIYVPTGYQYDEYRGIVRGSDARGKFVNINNFKVMYANGVGFSFNQPDSNFYDCTAVGNGRDGFAFQAWSAFSQLPERNRAYRCYASYNNAAGNGYGQAYTSYAPYSWFIDCVAEYNFKEGFDFLNYPGAGSDVHHGGLVYCTAYKNNQTPIPAQYGGAGIYIDGAHDMLIYGCKVYGSGLGNDYAGASGSGRDFRWSNNISISAEYSTTSTYNIHVVNNLLYDATGYNLAVQQGYGSNVPYGFTIVNNTIVRGPANTTTGYGACFLPAFTSTVRSIIKNNIFLRTSAGTANTKYPLVYVGTSLNSTNVDMDYNCFYDVTTGSVLAATGEQTPTYTLATWKTLTGGDAHSIYSNPNLVSTDFTAMDAHLTVATSPAIDAGVSSPWTPPSWVTDAAVLTNNGAVVGSTRPDGVSDSGSMDIGYHYYNPTPNGSLTATNVQPATLYLNSTNSDTITFTTATVWPLDGKLYVTYPISLGGGFTFNSTGTSAATFNSGGSGSLSVSIVGSVVCLTRSGGSDIAANQAVSISLSYVLNPPQAGSTGPYQLKTTTSTDATIDIDSSVSADQIIESPAGFGSTRISGVGYSGITLT